MSVPSGHLTSMSELSGHITSISVPSGHLISINVPSGLLVSISVPSEHLTSISVPIGHLNSTHWTCQTTWKIHWWLSTHWSGVKIATNDPIPVKYINHIYHENVYKWKKVSPKKMGYVQEMACHQLVPDYFLNVSWLIPIHQKKYASINVNIGFRIDLRKNLATVACPWCSLSISFNLKTPTWLTCNWILVQPKSKRLLNFDRGQN